jgi:very-short-patch-repair endonuclease
MTKAEVTLWYRLKAKQLLGYKFRRQHGIDKYVVDSYCPERMLAIELDGDRHESNQARLKDAGRQRHIEQYGIWFLRFSNDEVLGDPDRVVKKIEETVRRLESAKPTTSVSPLR